MSGLLGLRDLGHDVCSRRTATTNRRASSGTQHDRDRIEDVRRKAESARRIAAADTVPLVHPTRYLEWVEWARGQVCG